MPAFTGTCNYSMPTKSPLLIYKLLISNKVSLRTEPHCQLPLLLVYWSYQQNTVHTIQCKLGDTMPTEHLQKVCTYRQDSNGGNIGFPKNSLTYQIWEKNTKMQNVNSCSIENFFFFGKLWVMNLKSRVADSSSE